MGFPITIDLDISKIAALIGDKARAEMLAALMDGKALTAGELAIRANISPQSASNHLKKLQEAKLIELIKASGRHRYYQLKSNEVAQSLESLAVLSEKTTVPGHEKLDPEICYARSCYKHLAGELGVRLLKGLIKQGYLTEKDGGTFITKSGEAFFKQCEIDCDVLRKKHSQVCKPCLDWTERQFHLAGGLCNALLAYLFEKRLLIRSKKPRVIKLTEAGKGWFHQHRF